MLWRIVQPILILPGTALVLVPLLIQWSASDWPFAELASKPWQVWIAIVVAVPALALGAWTIRLFASQGHGTLAPWDPPTTFVASGPYRHVRNPMLTAVNLLILAESIGLASVPLALWAVAFFSTNTLYFKFVEEPGLERRFGETYRRYKAEVPRWLPRMRPYSTENTAIED